MNVSYQASLVNRRIRRFTGLQSFHSLSPSPIAFVALLWRSSRAPVNRQPTNQPNNQPTNQPTNQPARVYPGILHLAYRAPLNTDQRTQTPAAVQAIAPQSTQAAGAQATASRSTPAAGAQATASRSTPEAGAQAIAPRSTPAAGAQAIVPRSTPAAGAQTLFCRPDGAVAAPFTVYVSVCV